MPEAPGPAPTAALTAWLAAPADPHRLAALEQASRVAPIPAATIDRLSAVGLHALQRAEGVRLAEPRPAVRAAIMVCGLAKRLGVEAKSDEQRDLDQMPFTVRIEKHGIVVEVQANAERRNSFGQPVYHQWVAGVTADSLTIDCHRVEHVNSVLIAWMLQICQLAKPTPVHVARARPQVETQLKQLRLDHLMRIGKAV